VPPLRDVLTPRPRILFVGINPSLHSERAGHHFAGPGNPFWRLLYAARIVEVPMTYAEDGRLAEFGLALTNLCSRATRSADELRPREIERGRRVLMRKIRRLRPAIVAFVGVSIYRRLFHTSPGGAVGARPETIHGARVFVLPNPSGRNANFPGFQDKLVWFERLHQFAKSPPAAANPAEEPSRRGRKRDAVRRSITPISQRPPVQAKGR
jgi:double-stranded uracil-DNA glycosylase